MKRKTRWGAQKHTQSGEDKGWNYLIGLDSCWSQWSSTAGSQDTLHFWIVPYSQVNMFNWGYKYLGEELVETQNYIFKSHGYVHGGEPIEVMKFQVTFLRENRVRKRSWKEGFEVKKSQIMSSYKIQAREFYREASWCSMPWRI